MNIWRQLNDRSSGSGIHWSRLNVSSAFEKYQGQQFELPSDPFDEYNINPPLGSNLRDGHLAISTEKGQVYIMDTTSVKFRPLMKFQPHMNAVFDVKWRPGHKGQIVTVSGDQSFALWDLENPRFEPREESVPLGDFSQDISQQDNDQGLQSSTGEMIALYRKPRAHLSSIKSCSFQDENVFATCSRDGNVHVWDLRISMSKNPERSEVTIPDAHTSNPVKGSKTRKSSLETIRSKPTSSTTCVLFQSQTCFLFSSGANDGLIKLWDLRKIPNNVSRTKKGFKKGNSPTPVREFSFPGRSNFSRQGFSDIKLDSKFRIYGSCTDSKIYCFNPASSLSSSSCDIENDSKSGLSDSRSLIGIFAGHRSNNFTKIKIMNDYLISGSQDSISQIWNLKTSLDRCDHRSESRSESRLESSRSLSVFKPIISLPHFEEVTTIEADNFSNDIFTCTDDCKVHKWSLHSYLRSPIMTPDASNLKFAAKKYFNDDEVEIQLDQFVISKKTNYQSATHSTPSPLATLHNYFTPQGHSSQGHTFSDKVIPGVNTNPVASSSSLAATPKRKTNDNDQYLSSSSAKVISGKKQKIKRRSLLFPPELEPEKSSEATSSNSTSCLPKQRKIIHFFTQKSAT